MNNIALEKKASAKLVQNIDATLTDLLREIQAKIDKE